EEELLGFCFLLVLAGNDTTSSLIGNGIVLLIDNPDQRAMLADDPSRWPGAIEEMNRTESPTQVLRRTTTRDVDLHDTIIAARSVSPRPEVAVLPQARLAGHHDALGPVFGLDLREHVRHVIADGLGIEIEPAGDGLVAQAGGDEVEHLELTCTQCGEWRRLLP